jgi:Clp amino terminal domain, pathogenicity island component
MYKDFTDQARHVIALAEQEARQLNHEYVGTEHLLLAIVADDSGLATEALRSLGVRADDVRHEIEKLVQRGPTAVTLKVVPLTPRAQRAIEFAIEETRYWSQKLVGPEHLLLGLARESDGVAGQALRNLGLKPKELAHEVLKIRIVQMKIVERAVRPVRAGVPCKRRMREELVAHLAAIYEQELLRFDDPSAAMEEAARRFGDPAGLARELEAALPYHERLSHLVERWFAWRAPETTIRFSLRLARQLFYILAVVLGLVGGGITLLYGWIADVQAVWRVFAAILLIAPASQFVVGVLYYRMRDAMWGVFGRRKSLFHALLFDALIALVMMGSFAALVGVATWDWVKMNNSLPIFGTAGVAAAIIWLFLARLTGRSEIRDTIWAFLDIDGASAEMSGPRRGDDSAAEPA